MFARVFGDLAMNNIPGQKPKRLCLVCEPEERCKDICQQYDRVKVFVDMQKGLDKLIGGESTGEKNGKT